jgi:uncharacterized protein YcbX
MKISKLYRYPVKSLGGQSVSSLQPEIRGFEDDRRWMFVDQDGKFISRRTLPKMCEHAAEIHGDELRFVRESDGSVLGAVAGARTGSKHIDVTVWDDSLTATLIEDDNIPAIAEGLGIPGARLVYMGTDDRRSVDPRFAKAGEEVSFADGFPYLVTSTASLADLSERVGEELDERRFRPNIIVENTLPFEEDDWAALKIGSHSFRLPKPCARCIMITQEPETGDRNLRVLAELSAYRKVGHKVMFGMNACWEGGEGSVQIGDLVTAPSA